MRHIKYILFLLLFAFVSQLTFAAGAVTLVLKLKNSDAVEKFKLATKPVVTFENGDSLRIHSIDVETTRAFTDVEKFYFEVEEDETIEPDPKTDAIDELQEDATEKVSFEFAYDGRVAQIKGLGEAPKVAVFNTAGVQAQPRTVITSNAVTITMSELPAGIYVIRANDRSFKIIKK